jgi:cytochrome oxidase Cu insertion factor (SCO1/SenC/PrrC family)
LDIEARMIALLILACSSKAPTAAGAIALHGERPTTPVAAPDFHAIDQHGQPRTRDALFGHPTVMWFYPAAATAG